MQGVEAAGSRALALLERDLRQKVETIFHTYCLNGVYVEVRLSDLSKQALMRSKPP